MVELGISTSARHQSLRRFDTLRASLAIGPVGAPGYSPRGLRQTSRACCSLRPGDASSSPASLGVGSRASVFDLAAFTAFASFAGFVDFVTLFACRALSPHERAAPLSPHEAPAKRGRKTQKADANDDATQIQEPASKAKGKAAPKKIKQEDDEDEADQKPKSNSKGKGKAKEEPAAEAQVSAV